MTKANACVLGSPHFRNFDKDEVQTGINLNGFPTDRKPLKKDDPVWGGRRATLIAGWTIENIIQLGDDDRQGLFARVRNTGMHLPLSEISEEVECHGQGLISPL